MQGESIILLDRERRADERSKRLRSLYELSMMLSGDPREVFRQVARMIGELFDVPVVCLSEVCGDRLHFLSVYRRGVVEEDAGVCSLAVTPCATVESDREIHVYHDVANLFPGAAFLADNNAVTYCGFPALDNDGRVVAVTCLLDDKERDFSDEDRDLLRVFGQRIAREVERQREIAERREIADRLHASERSLRSLVESFPGPIVLKDGAGRFKEVNQAFVDWFGLTRDGVAGKTTAELFPTEVGQAFSEQERQVRENRRPLTWKTDVVRADGSRRAVSLTRFPVLDAAGDLVGLGSIAFDITAAQQAERAFRESEERLRAVFENTPVALNLKDVEGRYLLVNKPFEDWVDRPAAELIGHQAGEFLDADEAAKVRHDELAVLRTGLSNHGEISVVRPDGQIRDRILLKFPVFSENGTITAIGTAGLDITDRKQTERRLRDALEAAQTANKAKQEFLANMSHELRTPLNAIIGFSEIIRSQTFGPIGNVQYHGYAKDIYDSGCHLLDIINDILDLAKIEAGHDDVNEEEIDVSEITNAVRMLVRERAAKGAIELKVDVSADLPPMVADRRKLKQILLNILSNAVKFTMSGGHVLLRVRCGDDGGYAFTVIDDGIGMAETDIPNALSAFGQVDSHLTRKHEGTGLGLPLAKALMEQHGGTLDLHSELGSGTTVTMTFPPHRTLGHSAGRGG